MSSVHTIANELIKIANEKGGLISHLKLQKLLYFAQGHYLADYDKALFSDDIAAWQHGPVCNDIYQIYKGYSYNNISKPEQSVLEMFGGKQATLSSEIKQFLEKIWDAYGKFSGKVLEELSHAQTPWKEAYQEGVQGIIIPQESIKEYFKSVF